MIRRLRIPRIGRSTLILVLAVAALAFPLGVLANHQFSDVPTSASFHDDVEALVAAGITTGCGGGEYCPADAVTRGQMAQFLNRLGSLDGNTPPSVDADKVDGVDAFAGRGTAELGDVVDPDQNRTALGSIPGLGSFTVGGAFLGPGDDCDITFTNESGANLVVNGDTSAPLANGASIELVGRSSRPDGVSATFSITTAIVTTVASGQVVLMFGYPGGNTLRAGSVQAQVSG